MVSVLNYQAVVPNQNAVQNKRNHQVIQIEGTTVSNLVNPDFDQLKLEQYREQNIFNRANHAAYFQRFSPGRRNHPNLFVYF